MLALAILLIAAALCGGLLWAGPPIAESLIRLLPTTTQSGRPGDAIFTVLIFGSLLLFGLIAGRIAGRNAAGGGARPLRHALAGTGFGLVGVTVTALYAWLAGGLASGPTSPSGGVLACGAALIFLQSFAEEVYFRGWLQPLMINGWGTIPGIAATSILFAGLHVLGGARAPVSVLNLFLGGVLFGMLAYRSGGIAGAVAAHFAWNVTEDVVLGLIPNPGLGPFGALFNFELNGTSLWGGSEEGLNGSIAMTLALGALLVVLGLLGRGATTDAPTSAEVVATT